MSTRIINGILIDDECASQEYLHMLGITREDLARAPLYIANARHETEQPNKVVIIEKKNKRKPGEKTKVDLWAEWSLAPHTEDEIREKILTDFDGVCFTYLCGTQVLSENFIVELMALSTGLLNKENYGQYIEEMKQAVLIAEGIEGGKIDYHKLPKISAPGGQDKRRQALIDRLDWVALFEKQTLSSEFRAKFKPLTEKNDPKKKRLVQQNCFPKKINSRHESDIFSLN